MDLFGARGGAAGVHLPSHIGYLVSNLPSTNNGSHCLSISSLINNNTLLPFYSPFIPPERLKRIQKYMESSDGSAIHNEAGITPSTVRSPNWLRFCPLCVEDDQKEGEDCYWHRLHQVPGVEVCPLHRVFLENSNIRARNRTNSSVYVSAEQTVCVTSARLLNSSIPAHQVLLNVARDAAWLLSQTDLHFSYNSLRDRYFMILADNELITAAGKIRLNRLIQVLRSKFSHHLLGFLQCDFNEQKDFNWPSWIIPHLNHNKTDPPIRHLLFIQSLGYSAESFFRLSIKRRAINAPQPTKPFGNGPWPCLNPTCKFYRQLIIKTYTCRNEKPKYTPVGTFTCICGFSYARKGPIKSSEDTFRYDWVKSYGPVWEVALRKLWKDSSISIHHIARSFKVAHNTIKNHAVRLGLKFPRKGPGPKISRVDPELQKYLVQYRLEKSEANKAKTRASKRIEWLSILKKNPNSTRSSLATKIAPRLYGWLRTHDREWLRAHMPSHFKRIGSARQVDWNDRDIQLSQAVRASAERLRAASGRPVRVTKQSIGQDLDKVESVANKRAMVKLPLTTRALEEVVETRTEFAIRRIRWAAESFRQENIVPAWSTLGLRARIDHAIWYVPSVKAVFEEELLSLQETRPRNKIEAA